jgi:acyl-coenzyme A thioesterase PaaI-like protein
MADEQPHQHTATDDDEQPKRDQLNDTSTYQRCFACGARNDAGLRLVFRREGEAVVTEFTTDERFQGFPGVVHGGILATLLDETLNRLAMAEGRMMMTARLDIRYRGVAPVGRPLRVSARARSSRARMLQAEGEIRLADAPGEGEDGDGDGAIIATAEGIFLPVPGDYQRDATSRTPELVSFFNLE